MRKMPEHIKDDIKGIITDAVCDALEAVASLCAVAAFTLAFIAWLY